jgi:histidine phosphotransferase ChpT
MSATHLTALLCSRLCHDLISPIGAVNNGIEILADEQDADMRAQAIDLMAHSALEAARRLAFFRLAFGAAGGMGDSIRIEEARQAAQGMFVNGRTRLDWPTPPGEAYLPKAATKILLNLVLIGAAALPRGGQLKVQAAPSGNGAALSVRAVGEGVRLVDETRRALEEGGDESALDPHSVVAHLVHLLARDAGAKLTAALGADGLELGATLP